MLIEALHQLELAVVKYNLGCYIQKYVLINGAFKEVNRAGSSEPKLQKNRMCKLDADIEYTDIRLTRLQ